MGERTFERSVELPVDADTAFAWHLAPGALRRLLPGFARVEVVDEPAVAEGAVGVLRVQKGPVRLTWRARITEVDSAARRFVDVQDSGPFASWRHEHRVEPLGPRRARLVDTVHWRAPLGSLGAVLGDGLVARDLARLFGWRHRVTAHDLGLHARYGLPRQVIALTGASGFVGSRLDALLSAAGHRVLRLVRRPASGPDEVTWDPRAGTVDAAALEGVDAVVHLAGEPVVGLRWTAEKKRRIAASRVAGSRALVDALLRLARPPRVLVAASAVGYFGDRGDEPLTEASPPGSGFLADTCRAWEAETGRAAARMRVAQLRLGVVLDPGGGALRVMLPAFLAGAGGPLAGGRAWFPWVALDDVLGALVHALATESLQGPANLASPAAERQGDFARTLGRVVRRPAFAPVPRAAVRALLGREQADEMLLASARVEPTRLLDSGFQFAFPALEGALRHGLGR